MEFLSFFPRKVYICIRCTKKKNTPSSKKSSTQPQRSKLSLSSRINSRRFLNQRKSSLSSWHDARHYNNNDGDDDDDDELHHSSAHPRLKRHSEDKEWSRLVLHYPRAPLSLSHSLVHVTSTGLRRIPSSTKTCLGIYAPRTYTYIYTPRVSLYI